jgi:hypothetical protein
MRQEGDEPPPLLGTWNRVYAAILLYLAGIISLFYLFTQTYNQ